MIEAKVSTDKVLGLRKGIGKDQKVLLLLIALVTLFGVLFLTIGLTEKNMDYFLPRRIKKVLGVLLASYCVGYSAVSFQTITNNKILTPSIIGLDSLYLFLQTIIVFFFGQAGISKLSGFPNYMLSIGFMVLCSFFLFFFMWKGDGKNLYFMVLAGTIFGGLFSGMASFMQVLMDPNEFSLVQGKMFASFNQMNTDLLSISIGIVLIVAVVARLDYGKLNVLSLGQAQAINLGISYQRIVFRTLIMIAILTAVSTALVGPITFLGIMVVSVARNLVSSYRHEVRVPVAVLLGAVSLLAALFFVERVLHHSTQISVVINFIGGCYFIYLMLKEGKS